MAVVLHVFFASVLAFSIFAAWRGVLGLRRLHASLMLVLRGERVA